MKEILLTSSVLILALLALRRLFRRTISRRMQYTLWALVLVRLLVPLNVGTLAHNVLSAAEPVQTAVKSGWKRPSCTCRTVRSATPLSFCPARSRRVTRSLRRPTQRRAPLPTNTLS